MQKYLKKEREKKEMLWFNLFGVEIRELRPEVVTKGKGVLVHYQSGTNVTKVIF